MNPGSATGAFSPLWTPPPTPSTISALGSPSPSSDAPDLKPDTAQPSNGTPPSGDSATKLAATVPAAASPSSAYPPEPTPSFALLDIQGTVVVRRLLVPFAGWSAYHLLCRSCTSTRSLRGKFVWRRLNIGREARCEVGDLGEGELHCCSREVE